MGGISAPRKSTVSSWWLLGYDRLKPPWHRFLPSNFSFSSIISFPLHFFVVEGELSSFSVSVVFLGHAKILVFCSCCCGCCCGLAIGRFRWRLMVAGDASSLLNFFDLHEFFWAIL